MENEIEVIKSKNCFLSNIFEYVIESSRIDNNESGAINGAIT